MACRWDENDDVIQQKACTHNPTRQLKRAQMKDDYQYGDRKIQKAVMQCWGKILLKVMHNNIELLPKKVTNYVT